MRSCCKCSEVFRVQAKFTPAHAVSPSKASRRLVHKGYTAISHIWFDSVGIVQQDAFKQPGETPCKGWEDCLRLPWDTSAEDVLTRTGWDSLETMYKVRFVFKCMKGFTVTEFKGLFIQRESGRRRKDGIILPRPETNFIRNSISYRGAIAWNSLTNKENNG